jgi:hypothetical protein
MLVTLTTIPLTMARTAALEAGDRILASRSPVAQCKANEAPAFNDLLNVGREMSLAPIFATRMGWRVVQVLPWILDFSP